MAQVLDTILAYKRKEVEAAKTAVSEAALRKLIEALPPVRPFAPTLRKRLAGGELALIAEIKRASPSKGLIRADFDPVPMRRGAPRAFRC